MRIAEEVNAFLHCNLIAQNIGDAKDETGVKFEGILTALIYPL